MNQNSDQESGSSARGFNNINLDLSLFINPAPPPPPSLQPVIPPEINPISNAGVNPTHSRASHGRPPRKRRDQLKTEKITPPHPWASDSRATVHSLNELGERNIAVIYGEVKCNKCGRSDKININVMEKYTKIREFIAKNKYDMRCRAPENWKKPKLGTCRFCSSLDSLKPKFPARKRDINWLFLLLGELIGCCKLTQLKYLCKHNGKHRTAEKDRLVYTTYLVLCNQLDPRQTSLYYVK